jgi:ketosteroid isomerase-like protein
MMTETESHAREAIRQTIQAYSIAGDQRDAAKFAALWTEDALFTFAGFDPLPGFRCQGISEIRARVASWNPARGKDPSLSRTRFIRHNLTTSEIELTGPDSAAARTYFVVVTEHGPDHAGVYSDQLVCDGERWLLRNRAITLDWRSPASLFPPLEGPPGKGPHQANVDLMNAYAHALDTRDWDLFASLFTADTEFAMREWADNAVPKDWSFEIKGRDALTGMLQNTWDGLSATHHMLSNYVVNPASDGMSAKASCYLRAHHVGNRERSRVFEESLGRFDFATVLEHGTWKIARMEENIFIMLGTADAFAGPPL